jgi:hypothetical protein
VSDQPQPARPIMPLFYKRVVGVNPAVHGGLKLDRSVGYGFTAGAQSVPIGLGEFQVAAQFYPIVFTTGPTPTAVALLGLREGQNLFVGPDGQWRTDMYIPAYVRAFPFIFVEDSKTENVYVGMEPDAACLKSDSGVPMFEDGKPSQVLSEAISFCTSFRDNLNAARVFSQALNEAGLLTEEEATITFTAGGSTRIRGFKLMHPDALAKVDDTTFLDWRARGWLNPIYAHLFSSGRWSRLIEIAAKEHPAAAA